MHILFYFILFYFINNFIYYRDLHKNQLEGDIPDSLKELQNLKRL